MQKYFTMIILPIIFLSTALPCLSVTRDQFENSMQAIGAVLARDAPDIAGKVAEKMRPYLEAFIGQDLSPEQWQAEAEKAYWEVWNRHPHLARQILEAVFSQNCIDDIGLAAFAVLR